MFIFHFRPSYNNDNNVINEKANITRYIPLVCTFWHDNDSKLNVIKTNPLMVKRAQ